MKNISLLLAVILLLLTGHAVAEGRTELSSLSAIEMTRLMGNGINLGNTLEACNNGKSGGNVTDDVTFYETMWGQPVTTAEMLRGMKTAGFDTVRIPVAWMTNATHLNQGDYRISELYLDRVETIVRYALDAGMFVIVNDHWDGGWWGMFGSESENTRNLARDAYTGMWRQIAERFRNYDERLIFESANEELGARFDENSPLYCSDSLTSLMPEQERYELTNRLNQLFVDTVRAAGGFNTDRFLLIAGYGTDIRKTCDSRFRMPTDTADRKLMISVHYYDPWSYCGASAAKGATPWGKKKDYQDMFTTLEMLKKFTAEDYGVVIGEYGALPGNDGSKENAPSYHEAFLNCCDALDFTSCLWDCSSFFVRNELTIPDKAMAAVYGGRNAASETGRTSEEIAVAGRSALDALIEEAPESLVENAAPVTDDTCVAWIMFSEGSWSQSYSVGDTYTPDAVSPGIKAMDAEITGPGGYTVSLDFTNTEKGYAENTAFCAVGISNGELKYPGYCIWITEVKINGEPVKLTGRNYTCSDDLKCTRTNLYNEWVDMKSARAGARVLMGDLTGISATLLDRSLPALQKIHTLEVTFRYEPRK